MKLIGQSLSSSLEQELLRQDLVVFVLLVLDYFLVVSGDKWNFDKVQHFLELDNDVMRSESVYSKNLVDVPVVQNIFTKVIFGLHFEHRSNKVRAVVLEKCGVARRPVEFLDLSRHIHFDENCALKI